MSKKKQILQAIVSLAKKLGRAPSREEFLARSGISAYFVLQSFRSWNEAVKAAGLNPYTRNVKVEDRALLEDWGEAVRRNRAAPPVHIYRRKGKYNPGTLIKRFGPWTTLPGVFRHFAKRKREWRDVLPLLRAPDANEKRVPVGPCRGALQRVPISVVRTSPGVCHYKPLKARARYGNPIDFPGFRHEPLNEQGVVLLFGMLAKDLGYTIEAVQKGFPDCEAKREIAPGRWQRVNIEFEFESKNFRDHGHPVTGCDVIVCWRHNWRSYPPHLEVLELSSVIKSLVNSGD